MGLKPFNFIMSRNIQFPNSLPIFVLSCIIPKNGKIWKNISQNSIENFPIGTIPNSNVSRRNIIKITAGPRSGRPERKCLLLSPLPPQGGQGGQRFTLIFPTFISICKLAARSSLAHCGRLILRLHSYCACDELYKMPTRNCLTLKFNKLAFGCKIKKKSKCDQKTRLSY